MPSMQGSSARAMQSGFNTNFRYRGVLFHVQTEDSGLGNPHVITHLFHGGNIMASEKRDYSELIADHAGESLLAAVRKLMEGQHKSMLKQLSRGEHDAAIEQRMGVGVFQSEGASGADDPQPITEEERPPRPRAASSTAAASAAAASPSPAAGSKPSPAQAEPTRLDNPRPVAEETPPVVSRLSRVFGERVAAEKPLDEMVLDYLVENARNKRKRSGK
jgi:hypothetical protein